MIGVSFTNENYKRIQLCSAGSNEARNSSLLKLGNPLVGVDPQFPAPQIRAPKWRETTARNPRQSPYAILQVGLLHGALLGSIGGVCDSNGSQHQTRFRRFLGRAGLSSAPNWAHFLHFLDGPCFCL